MEHVGMVAKEESRLKDILNNEEGNIRYGKIWVNMNGTRNDNPSELLQTVKDLRVELKRVKEDNEHIFKAHEELNNVPLTKLHSNEE